MIFRPLVIQYRNYFTSFKKSIKEYYGLTSLRNLLFIKPDRKLYYQDNLETEFCISHPDWSDLQNPPTEFPPEEHAHDDLYFTEAEVTSALAGKADSVHAHSNIDADTLDGQHGSYYQNAGNLNAGTINLARLPATLTGKDADTLDGQHGSYYRNAGNLNNGTIPQARIAASDVLTLVKTVDGSGSGLDADLLDGQQATNFTTSGTVIYRTTAQNIAYNQWVTLDYSGGGYVRNDNGGWDGNTALYAQATGWHLLWASVTFQALIPGLDILLRIMLNGAELYGGQHWQIKTGNGGVLGVCIPYYVNVNQYIQAQVFQLYANPTATTGGTGNGRATILGLVKI